MSKDPKPEPKVDPKTQREAEELALGYGIPAAAEQHRQNQNDGER